MVKVNYKEGMMHKFAIGKLISENDNWVLMYDKFGKKIKIAQSNIDTMEYD